MHTTHYRHLLIMLFLSFATMYALMYAMVDSMSNVFMNLNQVYMAALMTAPMALIEIVVMRSMYKDQRLNMVVGGIALLVLLLSWTAIRQQAAISDSQFLRSMIPHHGGAILMCNEAPVRDESIKALCTSILSSQQAEIDQMKALLSKAR